MIFKDAYRYLTLIFLIILGSYNGYVALFQQGRAEPVQIFPYSVTSLPPADQALLDQGIVIGSLEQLQMLLEDYLS